MNKINRAKNSIKIERRILDKIDEIVDWINEFERNKEAK